MPFFERANGTIANSSTFNEIAGNQTNNTTANSTSNTNSNNINRTSSINSNNRRTTTNVNSNNDSSVKQTILGTAATVIGRSFNAARDVTNNVDNFYGSYSNGDNYNGPIYGSTVGGRGNVNIVKNSADASAWNEQIRQAEEQEEKLKAELRDILAKIEAKRAQQRVTKLAEEVAAARAELAELENPESARKKQKGDSCSTASRSRSGSREHLSPGSWVGAS